MKKQMKKQEENSSTFESKIKKANNQAELEIIVRAEKNKLSEEYKNSYHAMMTTYENTLIMLSETRMKKESELLKRKNQLINELEALGDSEADKMKKIKVASEIRELKAKVTKVQEACLLGRQKASVVIEQEKRQALILKSKAETSLRSLADKKFLELAIIKKAEQDADKDI